MRERDSSLRRGIVCRGQLSSVQGAREGVELDSQSAFMSRAVACHAHCFNWRPITCILHSLNSTMYYSNLHSDAFTVHYLTSVDTGRQINDILDGPKVSGSRLHHLPHLSSVQLASLYHPIIIVTAMLSSRHSPMSSRSHTLSTSP